MLPVDIPNEDENAGEETDTEAEADSEYTDVEAEDAEEQETVKVPVAVQMPKKAQEEFRRGYVRDSVDSNDDDDDAIVMDEDEDEEEEESDEEEEEEDEDIISDYVDEDAVDQETLAHKLNDMLQEKEELIREYLTLAVQSDRLKLRNMYLEDYLYNLCFRKNLLYENTEVHRTQSFNARAASKARHHKRKLDKKMTSNFEAFVSCRRKPEHPPPYKISKEDKKKRESRLRKLLHERLRAPQFEKKVENKIFKLRKKDFQREFRSRGRNWEKRVELDEDMLIAQKAAQHQQDMKNPQKKVLTGIKMGIQHLKPRVLIEKAGKATFMVTKDGKVIDAAGNVVDTRKDPEETEKAPETSGECGEAILSHVSMLRTQSATTGPSILHANFATTIAQVPAVVPSKKRQTFASRLKSKLFFEGISIMRLPRRHNQDIEKKLEKMKKFIGFKGAVHKVPCNPRKKGFSKLRWFKGRKLTGRKSPGEKLHTAEKQHVINFVEDAVHNLPQRKKVAKLKVKQHAASFGMDYEDAMDKFIVLIKKYWELQVNYKKSMEEKFADWGLWEKRNYLCVEGLAVLFNSFVLQPYLSEGLKGYQKDIVEFTNLLYKTHSGLMRQLVKMFKSKLSLAMIERKLKDTSNPALVNNGYSAEVYMSMLQENGILYTKLSKIDQLLQDERRTLGRTLKIANVTHERKHLLKKLVTHCKAQTLYLSDSAVKQANKIKEVKSRLTRTQEDNWNLFFKGSLFERPNLMQDFGIRKLTMSTNERARKELRRKLYLRRREMRILHIKMTEVRAYLKNLHNTGTYNRNTNAARFHAKNILNGGMDRFICMSLAKCDSKFFNDYHEKKPKQTKSSVSTRLDRRF